MKCPHCYVMFHDTPQYFDLNRDDFNWWRVTTDKCPNCGKFVIMLVQGHAKRVDHGGGRVSVVFEDDRTFIVWPQNSNRPPAPPEVPKELAEDFNEASLILHLSPKASAALSRRCLQILLEEHANIKLGSLAKEIQVILDENRLPPHLAESIDAIRKIGNFAAHPMKDKETGLIAPVEPGEAEWLLDTLEGLFDFYFVQPEKTRKRKKALNEKLERAGRDEMK